MNSPAELRASYLERLAAHYRYLPDGSDPTTARLRLETLFIDLPVEEQVTPFETVQFPPPVIKRRLTVSRIMRQYRRAVILGEPGSGKTTCLKWVTLTLAANQGDRLGLPDEPCLPLFISLTDYAARKAEQTAGYSLLDYLYTHVKTALNINLPPRFFETALEQGHGCLCLDGLDEAGGSQPDLMAALLALVERYPQNRFLVAGRRLGHPQALFRRRDFAHLLLLPLREGDRTQLVQKWARASEPNAARAAERAARLLDAIAENRNLKQLATSPLQLTLLAAIYRPAAALPHSRAGLYQKSITALVDAWGQALSLSPTDRQRPFFLKRRFLLQQLAYWLHIQPDGQAEPGLIDVVTEGDLRLQVIQFLREDLTLDLDRRTIWQEAADFIEMIKSPNGLLAEQSEGLYAFRHPTLQAYLAAEYLKVSYAHTIDGIWAIIQPRLQDYRWRELLLFLLGSLSEFRRHPTALIQRIANETGRYEPLLHTSLFLAAALLAETAQTEVLLAHGIIDSLLALVRSHRLGWREAIDALARLSHQPRAAAGLRAIAEAPDVPAELRLAAAGALGRHDYPADALRLLTDLSGQPEIAAKDRLTAALAMGDLGQTDRMAQLLQELAANVSTPAGVRCVAAATYEQLDQERAVQLLLELVDDSGLDTAARLFATRTLAQLGQGQTAGRRLLALARDNGAEARIRREAIEALGWVGQQDDAGYAPALLELGEDQMIDSSIRRAALAAVGRLNQPAETTIDQLHQIAVNPERSTGTRVAAAAALARLGRADETVADALLLLGEDVNASGWVRRDAAVALGQMGQTTAAGRLLGALATDAGTDAQIRYDAAWTLGQLAWRDEAARLLLELAADQSVSAWVRQEAAAALGQMDRMELATTLLLNLAEDGKLAASVRRTAVLALGGLERVNETAQARLLAIAQREAAPPDVRQAAYQSLKMINGLNQTL